LAVSFGSFLWCLAENLSSKIREKNGAKFLGAKLVPENSYLGYRDMAQGSFWSLFLSRKSVEHKFSPIQFILL
jgi:hypothetical protein